MLHAHSSLARRLPLALALTAILLLIQATATWGQTTTDSIDFVHEVVPILKKHCVTCHGGRESEGGFSLNERASLLDYPAIDVKSPEQSLMLELVRSSDEDDQMPPSDRPRLEPNEIATLMRWIEEGAEWEPGFSFAINAYEPPLLPREVELPPVLGNRPHPIDRLIDEDLRGRGQAIPAGIDDQVFLRRIYLDLLGILPTLEEQRTFLDLEDPNKRERLIDDLLRRDLDYADHWLSFYNDLLRNDYSGTGFITGGRKQISAWLYRALLTNKPFDQFARELIAPETDESRGFIDGIKWRGEVSAGQTLEIQFAQSVTQSFLGINMKCASCHDSFIDRWTLKEAYGLGAIYADSPLELYRCDKPTGETATASWIFPELGQVDANAPRDERLKQLAGLMTHPENGRFSRTIVNRLWQRLMGRGIVHPLDAMQNEPWNEALLDHLANELVSQQYDLKAILKHIAMSQAYQARSVPAQAMAGDYEYLGPLPRRLTAEQFLDSVWQITDAHPQSFDAPVERSLSADGDAIKESFQGKWIWGALEDNAAPAGDTILLFKEFELSQPSSGAGVMVTCDNGYKLFVNGKLVSQSDAWEKPQSLSIQKELRQGRNEIVAIANNAGGTPNPAGFFFEARIRLKDSLVLPIVSDESWLWSPDLPEIKNTRLGEFVRPSGQVQLPVPVPPWSKALSKEQLGRVVNYRDGHEVNRPVRAALLKNTAFMKSLGRPMREQIVSMRPGQLSTLEAIDLANEQTLAAAFSKGAETWLRRSDELDDPKQLIQELFRATLCRPASDSEVSLFLEVLGDKPRREDLQDALWALCMLPEFWFVQ